jgi:hypothetical protein
MKGPYGVYLTYEGAKLLEDTFLNEFFFSNSNLITCDDVIPDPCYLTVKIQPPKGHPFVSHAHEFLIPHHLVLLVVSEADQRILGFRNTRLTDDRPLGVADQKQ